MKTKEQRRIEAEVRAEERARRDDLAQIEKLDREKRAARRERERLEKRIAERRAR